MPASSADAPAQVDARFSAAPLEDPGARLRRTARRVVSRLLGALLVLWGAATAAFLAQAVLPGDRATIIFNIRAGQPIERTPEELAAINAQYGFQDPVLTQYLHHLSGLVRGDLGESYQQFRPVTDVIGEQLAPTLVLTLTAIALAWAGMVVWVVLTAGRGRRTAGLGAAVDTATAGLPHYWLGIVLLLVFALQLRWFPVISGNSPAGLLLPALTLAVPLAGFMGQATRTEFERALQQPFVLSARTRGAGDLAIRLRHVLRHAALPAVTLSGWALGATISGAVVVETVYTRAGIGRVLVTAVNNQDLPIVTGVVLLVAALYVVANLLVDLVHGLVDPRTAKGGRPS
ncbi:ABC transporter permease subunit [Kineococcus sp. T13]|uniref:ABC transporter permease n=1 Tax=Kineococcus vitellinus TaxID=2696565 RepID=UPI0014133615|nr:ABC transporter permease [Kineococcus vitellinus]NAZ75384.1 ABC transporter permease subunit [Kineococcus vitellinus]